MEGPAQGDFVMYREAIPPCLEDMELCPGGVTVSLWVKPPPYDVMFICTMLTVGHHKGFALLSEKSNLLTMHSHGSTMHTKRHSFHRTPGKKITKLTLEFFRNANLLPIGS